MKLTPHNIVLDIETMSTRPNAGILSIGAVAIDVRSEHLIQTFYQNISQAGQVLVHKRHLCDKVMRWWSKQPIETQDLLRLNEIMLPKALQAFRTWVKDIKGKDGAISMWGNGATFDNVILKSAFDACDIAAPWHYRYDRCFRTLAAMFPEAEQIPFDLEATKHYALDDAIHEARQLLSTLSYIKSLEEK